MKYTPMDPTPFKVRRTSGPQTPVASFVADDRHGNLAHVVQVEEGMFTLYLSDQYTMRAKAEFVPYAATSVWPADIVMEMASVLVVISVEKKRAEQAAEEARAADKKIVAEASTAQPLTERTVKELRKIAYEHDIDLGKLRLKKDIVAAIEGRDNA